MNTGLIVKTIYVLAVFALSITPMSLLLQEILDLIGFSAVGVAQSPAWYPFVFMVSGVLMLFALKEHPASRFQSLLRARPILSAFLIFGVFVGVVSLALFFIFGALSRDVVQSVAEPSVAKRTMVWAVLSLGLSFLACIPLFIFRMQLVRHSNHSLKADVPDGPRP